MAVYDKLIRHVERNYVGIQSAIYRPAVSALICAPSFEWRETLSQLDELGLMSVLDTKRQLRDIARLSLLASRPCTREKLRAAFAEAERDLDATLALIGQIGDARGLDLIDTTDDDQIVSIV